LRQLVKKAPQSACPQDRYIIQLYEFLNHSCKIPMWRGAARQVQLAPAGPKSIRHLAADRLGPPPAPDNRPELVPSFVEAGLTDDRANHTSSQMEE
jgi:hypothetical protein